MQIKIVCTYCRGSGLDIRISDPPVQYECHICNGVGYHTIDIIGDELTDIMDKLNDIKEKMDEIKVMLDSPTLGLQKMSSNLDDIMVKLDV